MENKNIDFASVDQFKIACEDFIEEFRAKCARKYSNLKMLNVCFAVIWVFLNKVSEQGHIGENFIKLTEELLATEFLAIFKSTKWDMLTNEKEGLLLMISMLTNFFLKHNVKSD